MKWIQYEKPATLDHARAILKNNPDAVPVAGCTSCHFQTDVKEKTAVLLGAIPELSGIRRDSGTLLIGAATSVTDLLQFQAPGWVLDRVAACLASHQIRSVSTLGGNLARVFPWSDFPVALLALGATLALTGETVRELPADEFFKAQPANLFQPGEILSAIRVPAVTPPTGFGHVKQRMKSESFSLATASVKVTVKDGRLADPRVALGAAIAVPSRLVPLETRLTGIAVQDTTAMLDTIREAIAPLSFLSKEGMSKDYIRELAGVTLADALQQALSNAQTKGGRP